jgi:demethylspheroidene O-methyltransferase
VRRDSARLYDLVAGFVYSQTLLASVELGLLERLRRGPRPPGELSAEIGLSPDRTRTLCQAAAAVGLLTRRGDGAYGLANLGAAALGAPGLQEMIRHHRIFYRDLTDPVALLKGEAETDLSHFWPYVRGAEAAEDPTQAEEYSRLMATSQHHVAEQTLDAVSLRGVRRMVDIGGGTGVFLEHAAQRWPDLELRLLDLAPVAEAAARRLSALGLSDRIRVTGGDFLTSPYPGGCDAISLIRVLYDHDDATVRKLLARICGALPPGGRLIVSEPMSGGAVPNKAGDAYFGFYTMAMTTGRPRSARRHQELLREAGFTDIQSRPTRQPFLTSVVTARAPAAESRKTV